MVLGTNTPGCNLYRTEGWLGYRLEYSSKNKLVHSKYNQPFAATWLVYIDRIVISTA